MRIGNDFILMRAKITRHVQSDIKASWMWSEKTLEQWDHEIAGLQRMQEIFSEAGYMRNSTRAELDAALKDLHRRTMQWIAMAKFHFREDPSKLDPIHHLTSNGLGRRVTAREAMDLETAWKDVGPEWAPTETNTFSAFQTLRKQCLDLDTAFIAARGNWRTQSEILNKKAAELNKANTAWYAAATRIFPPGTAEGDMIRRAIPTKYSPPAPDAPPAPSPQPQEAVAQSSAISQELEGHSA
jgi:hypothetical protein